MHQKKVKFKVWVKKQSASGENALCFLPYIIHDKIAGRPVVFIELLGTARMTLTIYGYKIQLHSFYHK